LWRTVCRDLGVMKIKSWKVSARLPGMPAMAFSTTA
jgi:hypothetical protein